MIRGAAIHLRPRRALALAAGLAALAALTFAAPRHATAEADGLIADVSLTYDVHPEIPNVHVSWQVSLENSGPPFYAEEGDPPYYYDSVAIFVLGDGSALKASGPGGQRLPVSFSDFGEGLSGEATVSLPHTLQYGESFSFAVEYTVPAARNDYFLVGRSYVFLPAYLDILEADTLRSTSLHVSAPIGAWDVSVEGPTCLRSQQGPRTVQNCTFDDPYAAASVEVVQPTARQTTTTDIQMGDRTIRLYITSFRDDAAWAEHVREVAAAALPVLEQVMGSTLPRLDTLELLERGQGELLGYAGTAGCIIYLCRISLSPTSDDLVFLHELAHLWSRPFKARWLSEGLAEFTAREAAAAMGIQPDQPYRPPSGKPSYPLSEWGRPRSQLTATPEERMLESEGYYWAVLSFQRLKQTVGLDGLKATNAALSSRTEDSVTSRLYMDTLDATTSVNSDDLFRDWIFPADMAGQVGDRRQARDRLTALRAQAEPLGLTVDPSIQEDIDAWSFDDALVTLDRKEKALQAYIEVKGKLDELKMAAEQAGLVYPLPFRDAAETWDFLDVRDGLPQAEAALAAYTAAKRIAAEPRGFWQRIGLWGRDPDGKLADAASHFAIADFSRSLEDSRAVQEMIDGAGDAALQRLLIALGVLVALVISAALAVWFIRGGATAEPEQAGPSPDAP